MIQVYEGHGYKPRLPHPINLVWGEKSNLWWTGKYVGIGSVYLDDRYCMGGWTVYINSREASTNHKTAEDAEQALIKLCLAREAALFADPAPMSDLEQARYGLTGGQR